MIAEPLRLEEARAETTEWGLMRLRCRPAQTQFIPGGMGASVPGRLGTLRVE